MNVTDPQHPHAKGKTRPTVMWQQLCFEQFAQEVIVFAHVECSQKSCFRFLQSCGFFSAVSAKLVHFIPQEWKFTILIPRNCTAMPAHHCSIITQECLVCALRWTMNLATLNTMAALLLPRKYSIVVSFLPQGLVATATNIWSTPPHPKPHTEPMGTRCFGCFGALAENQGLRCLNTMFWTFETSIYLNYCTWWNVWWWDHQLVGMAIKPHYRNWKLEQSWWQSQFSAPPPRLHAQGRREDGYQTSMQSIIHWMPLLIWVALSKKQSFISWIWSLGRGSSRCFYFKITRDFELLADMAVQNQHVLLPSIWVVGSSVTTKRCTALGDTWHFCSCKSMLRQANCFLPWSMRVCYFF